MGLAKALDTTPERLGFGTSKPTAAERAESGSAAPLSARDLILARSLASELEMLVQLMAHDLARYGEWRRDYQAEAAEVRAELYRVLAYER